jgi:streptogrisin C
MKLAPLLLPVVLAFGAPAAAQTAPTLQTTEEALAQDAGEYAKRFGVAPEEAVQRLRALDASVAATDRIRARYADRLAGMMVEHAPDLRITVLLTGSAPVADEMVQTPGTAVPIVFRTGARATREAIVSAITAHQAALRASLRRAPAIGLDDRTGEMVVFVGNVDIGREGADALQARVAALVGVPVRVEPSGGAPVNLAQIGGARVVGARDGSGARGVCTTGFAVTDGVSAAVATAAHCPDELSYVSTDGTRASLPFVGQWGWGYRDVQVNTAAEAAAPLFFADTAKRTARVVEGTRTRASTRVGDFVCHRGERTGYSCAEVVMTDFAPAGDLCGGDCLPTWVAVAGPTCGAGDSGSPVFAGTTALGILKGGTYRPDGSCVAYYYMSLDYLPAPWRVLQR